MTNPDINSTQNPDLSANLTGDTHSFGPRLKQARMKQSITVAGVAKELFILPRHIEAIENQDFAALPEQAFSRGFVTNYAKFLKLDPEPLVASFNEAYPNDLKKQGTQAVTPLKPLGPVQRDDKKSMRINPLLIIGVIALLILAVFLLRMVMSAQNSVNTAENVVLVDELSESDQNAGAAVTVVPQSSMTPGSAVNLNSVGSAIETNVVTADPADTTSTDTSTDTDATNQ